MKQYIVEAKRFQQLAGIIQEDSDYIDNEDSQFSDRKIEVISSSDTKIKTKDDKLICGNIFYHGAMLNDIKKEELPQYFSKKGTRFEFKQKRLSTKAHEALFITPSFNEAHSWADSQVQYEFFSKGTSDTPTSEMAPNISPSVYKVTLKPGTILLKKIETHFGYGAKEELEKMGACGTYGGVNSKPSMINMMECGIINPNCISDWELISGGENLSKNISTDTLNPNVYNKKLNPKQFERLMKSMGVEKYTKPYETNPKWDEYKEKFLDPWYKGSYI